MIEIQNMANITSVFDDQGWAINDKRKLIKSYSMQMTTEKAIQDNVVNTEKKLTDGLDDFQKNTTNSLFSQLNSTHSAESLSSLKQNKLPENQTKEFSMDISKANSYKTASKKMVFQRTLDILKRDNIKQRALARELNISSSTLSSIINDKYKHLKDLHISKLREWCFDKDKSLVLSILKQLKLNKIEKKSIWAMFGIEEKEFLSYLDFSLPLKDRGQIDSILVPKIQQLILKSLQAEAHFSNFFQTEIDSVITKNKKKSKKKNKSIHLFDENQNDNSTKSSNYNQKHLNFYSHYPSSDPYKLNQGLSFQQQLEREKYELNLQRIRLQEQERDLQLRQYYFQQQIQNQLQAHCSYHGNENQLYHQQKQTKESKKRKIFADEKKVSQKKKKSMNTHQSSNKKNNNSSFSNANEINENINSNNGTSELYFIDNEGKKDFHDSNSFSMVSNDLKHTTLEIPAMLEKSGDIINTALFYGQQDGHFSNLADAPLYDILR